MAVTTLPSISLVKQLRTDFPSITFVKDDTFYWSPQNNAVHYQPGTSDHARLSLLHELGHAQLGHQTFDVGITLLDMEREAWHVVISQFAHRYAPDITAETVHDTAESALDFYRDWLHKRSVCPHCDAVGIETAPQTYHCLTCHGQWRVNDARACALRRYKFAA